MIERPRCLCVFRPLLVEERAAVCSAESVWKFGEKVKFEYLTKEQVRNERLRSSEVHVRRSRGFMLLKMDLDDGSIW